MPNPFLVSKSLNDLLKKRGAEEQLIMFLSGPAGAGKSHVINSCQEACKQFCDYVEISFDNDIFKITACTGSAAAQLSSGMTIHKAAKLDPKSKVTHSSPEWINKNTLFIDEVSFMSEALLVKIDRNLRTLTDVRNKPFGGVNLIFVGDFRQMRPVGGTPVYQTYSCLWHGAVNKAIFLKQSHRFKDDPEWGQMLERISKGTANENDFKRINERVIGKKNGVEIPNEGEVCYACPSNEGRNSINTKIFYEHVKSTHPKITDTTSKPPNNTIIIESKMCKDKTPYRRSFHESIFNCVGDANVKTFRNRHTDPALKLYYKCPIMINTNKDIEKGLANGTLARFLGVKLKNDDE